MTETVAEVPFEGEPVRLGNKTYIVPALSFLQLKRLRKQMEQMNRLVDRPTDALGDEELDAFTEVAYAALSRNYPEMKKDDLADLITLGNLLPLVEAVMGAAGLKKLMALSPTQRR